MKNILINADDFGWSNSCTDAIIESFQKGFLTTTTTVANGEAFEYAINRIIDTPYKDFVGIHFDLTEGRPLTDDIQKDLFFCDEDGMYNMHIDRYKKLTKEQQNEVYNELTAQVNRYKKTGLNIHHADSHHHIHTAVYITPIVLRVMKENDIKQLRISRNIGNISSMKFLLKQIYNLKFKRHGVAYTDLFGSFFDASELNKSKLQGKMLEIMCHPDYNDNKIIIDRASDSSYENPYGKELMTIYQQLVERLAEK